MAKYNWKALEKKWQKRWAYAKVHEADPDPRLPKYFVTAAYPYPNSPQHIGHGRTYTIADANARFHRMRGYNTLYPMGFHYTGTPLYAMAKRLSQGDQEIIQTFTDVYRIPRSDLEGLKEPRKMAEYFRNEIKKGMIEIGFSIDWRREFTTTDRLYNRFIQWHFRWLKDHGYITKGTHPVAWCPNDKNPVGVVDIQGDIEPELGEMRLIKFHHDGTVYPTATLRPETIFGVTNIWVNPQASYVQAAVDGEEWVVSRAAVDILEHQNHEVKIEKEFPGKELLWKFVQNPMNQSKIPILPADFVEPDTGTGVVMSVPGHAPYDYQALMDLKSSAAGSIEPEMAIVRKTEPISIIRLEGFSDLPAADVVRKFGVSGQKDSRLDEATKDLYSKEFHDGVMNDNAKPYSGMSVETARTAIVNDLTRDGQMSVLYELVNRPLTCRCGARLVVHVVNNQWFINYGDESWKKKAHQCLDQMAILPEERRGEFNYTVDWLRERACARKVGLGTRLPWDQEWIVEALSDSVIYMSYYILSKYISREWTSFKKFEKEPDQLTDSFFNYIFLGEGNPDAISKETGLSKRVIESIRKEFQYFYPVDIRHSAKDLVSNHLSFYIFNHTALFPEERWPRGIVANGFVLMNGEKMSKSLENIVPLRQAIAKFGADPLRLGTISTAELNQDTDFSESLATTLQERLVNLIQQSRKFGPKKTGKKVYSVLDRWMLNRLNLSAQSATAAMEKLRVREVVNIVLYHLDNDAAWYQRRVGPKSSKGDSRNNVLHEVYDFRARMLAPLAPHVAEEMWAALGNKGLVAEAEWPKANERLIDSKAEVSESIIKQTLEDTGEILRTTGMTAKKITFYVAPAWKWQIYQKALADSANGKKQGDFIKDVMGSTELRGMGKAAADYAAKSITQATQMKEELRRLRRGVELNEKRILEDAAKFFERELKAEVQVLQEGEAGVYDPKGKAKYAEPYRPAILVE